MREANRDAGEEAGHLQYRTAGAARSALAHESGEYATDREKNGIVVKRLASQGTMHHVRNQCAEWELPVLEVRRAL